jgi:predicted O-methyltransferase YrrM
MSLTSRLRQSAKFRLNPLHQEPRGAKARRRREQSNRGPEAQFVAGLALPEHILTGAGAGDYLFLDRYIRTRRPRRVLELGGGVTTYVMARAMNEIGRGELVSIEHIRKFADSTQALVPEGIRDRVQFCLTSIMGDRFNDRSALRYDEIPAGHYDMIFCDFTDAIGGAFGHYFPHIDPLLVLTDEPSDIITDRKLYSLNHYAKWLTCEVYYDPLLSLGIIPGVSQKDVGVSNKRAKLADAYEMLLPDFSLDLRD